MRTVITDRAGSPYSVQLLTIVLVIIIIIIIGRLTLVGQRPMKSSSSVCPSVRPSVIKFSQDMIISFFLVLCMKKTDHDFCTNDMVARIWIQGFSCHFLDFGSLVFLDIAYNNRLQQCRTSSRCKVCEKTKLHIMIACNTV